MLHGKASFIDVIKGCAAAFLGGGMGEAYFLGRPIHIHNTLRLVAIYIDQAGFKLTESAQECATVPSL